MTFLRVLERSRRLERGSACLQGKHKKDVTYVQTSGRASISNSGENKAARFRKKERKTLL